MSKILPLYPKNPDDIYVNESNVVTSISESSTDKEVPSAKTVYNAIQGSGGGGNPSDVNSVIQTDGSLWNVDGTSGVITTSKSEAAALVGVSEEIFDGIVAGNDARNLSIPNESTGEVLMVYLAGYYKQSDDYIGGTSTNITYTESINYKNVMLYVSAPAEGDASYNIFGLNLDGE